MGTVVQFERQSSERMVAVSHSASAPSFQETAGIDVERIKETMSKCEIVLVCTDKMLRGIEGLEKLDLIEPSSREAMEQVVRSVRLQLPSQLAALAQSLLVLRDIVERASKLLGSPQSLVAERQDFAEV